jgi:DNA-binding CsgD family transcriptional regulator
VHLVFWLYMLALLSGSASIAVALFVRSRHAKVETRRPVVLRFALVLLSLFLVVASMAVGRYAVVAVDPDFALAVIAFALMMIGAVVYVAVAPFFCHALVGDVVSTRLKAVYGTVAGLFLVLAATVFRWPSFRPTLIALNVLLLAMLVYAGAFIAVRYRTMGDRRLRRAVRTFMAVAVVFVPLIYLDSNLAPPRGVPLLSVLDGAALPIFCLVVCALAIRFAADYLDEPAYLEKGSLSASFRSAHRINDREREMIEMLVSGATQEELAERLSIPVETAEDQIHDICRRIQVRDGARLVSLIREHRAG